MPKSIHLLWRNGADDRWFDELRITVAGLVEAESVTVNVADSVVADAMLRLTTFPEPVVAVVQVWTAGPPADLRSLADDVAAYEVEETVRLAGPVVETGARTPGLANIALLRKPDDLDRAEWLRRWQQDHTKVAIETQATFGYVQNVVTRSLTADAPRIDGIVEELFPIEALRDPHAFYGSGGDQAELMRRVQTMAASVARFGADRSIDVIPTSRYPMR